MKHKTNIIIFALLILSISASAQIQFTAGLNYESGVPSGAPSSTGSRIRVNLATGRAYIWNQAGSNWRVLAQGIDIVAGCSAPLYTPGYGQSLFAINGCASPDLYYYTGTAWVQISGAGGATYYAGEGIDITNDTISVDTVQRLSFRTDQTYSDGLGTLSWDDTNGTLQLGMKGGNVSLQLGQESVQLVKHADNTGLSNGKVVYLTGSSGGNLTVRYAQANSESTSANTFGVMTEDATGGNKGFCTTFGLVHNINTSNLTEGGMVWLSKDTAGAMTAVRPTAPNNGVEVGFCVTKHATNGVIFVTVQNGYELEELHNVYIPSPTNGQVLTYNTTNTRWEAATVADQSATNELQTIDTFSLSGQTLSASLSSDNQPAKTVTLPIVDVVAGTNVTVTKSNGVATVSATGGGGGLSGVTGYVSQFNSSTTIDTTGLFWNGRLGINTASPSARFDIVGEGITSGTNAIKVSNSSRELMNIANNGAITIGKNDVTTTQNTSSIASDGADPNIGIAIVPKGIGAITAQIPNGLASGGNARGGSSCDLQRSRTLATQVASGSLSFIGGGQNNTVSGSSSAVIAGGSGTFGNTVSGTGSVIGAGTRNTITGNSSFIGNGDQNATGAGSYNFIGAGTNNATSSGSISNAGIIAGNANTISAASGFIGAGTSNGVSGANGFVGAGNANGASGLNSAVPGGSNNSATAEISSAFGGFSRAYLYGQKSIGSGRFGSSGNGDAQTSNIRLWRSITGTAATELFLDGASLRAILPLPTGATNGRLWNAIVQLSAICTTAGGTVTVGEAFIGTYNLGIKRIGATTSLVGTVQNMITAQSDSNMSTSAVTITADDGNDCLKIEFTPPSGANASTVIRVVATVYLTEVGY